MLAELQARLTAEPSLQNRLNMLSAAESTLRASLKTETDPIKKIATVRAIQRVQKTHAYEAFSDAATWKKLHQPPIEDLA